MVGGSNGEWTVLRSFYESGDIVDFSYPFSTQCAEPGVREVYPATNLDISGDLTTTPTDLTFTWTHDDSAETLSYVRATGYTLRVEIGALIYSSKHTR